MVEELDELARVLGLDFRDRSLLHQALVHRSYLNENPGTHLCSNERLEFLGDAVLDMLVAEFVFRRFPEQGEGDLTLWRSALVRTETLADFAAQLDLGRFLVMGRGEEADGGRTRTTILADAFEAVLGAVYLEGGIAAARDFLTPYLERALAGFAGRLPVDYKSALQIEVQGRTGITPHYRTTDAWGPDHARTFRVEVWAGDHLLGRGEGLSKQAAQQEAARVALEQLQRPAAVQERAAPVGAEGMPQQSGGEGDTPCPKARRKAGRKSENAPARTRAARKKSGQAP